MHRTSSFLTYEAEDEALDPAPQSSALKIAVHFLRLPDRVIDRQTSPWATSPGEPANLTNQEAQMATFDHCDLTIHAILRQRGQLLGW